jgi:RNA polymerase sigma-70 factor (ECF subfamily)
VIRPRGGRRTRGDGNGATTEGARRRSRLAHRRSARGVDTIAVTTLLTPARSVPPNPVRAALFPEHRKQREDIVRAVDQGDAVLVARMAAGDEEALAEVWQRHGPLVFGLARRVTGDRSTAEDVTQEVFVTLWQQPERFDAQRGSLRAYLGVHAQRRAIDAMRRDGRRSERKLRHQRLHPTATTAPGDAAGSSALSDTVRDAIGRLPADQRQVVELAYFGGLTHREVAATLGIPEGTAKSRLRLAQSKLQSWLDPNLLELV